MEFCGVFSILLFLGIMSLLDECVPRDLLCVPVFSSSAASNVRVVCVGDELVTRLIFMHGTGVQPQCLYFCYHHYNLSLILIS